MATAKALDKKQLWREIDRDERRKARDKLVELRQQLRQARSERKQMMVRAVERCRGERLAARERARALRIRGLAELREAARLERVSARDACAAGKAVAKNGASVARRRAVVAAEAKYQTQMRGIERGNRLRRREHPHATHLERRSESDDEVRANISADMLPLFERVRRGIKASPRMTRTEAFLKYAEEHPDEVLSVIEDRTEILIQDLERQYREAAGATRRPAKARRQSFEPKQTSSTPF